MVGLSPRELCGAIVGPSCAKDYDPFNQPWNVTIPGNKPPVKPVNPPKVSASSVFSDKVCMLYFVYHLKLHCIDHTFRTKILLHFLRFTISGHILFIYNVKFVSVYSGMHTDTSCL